MVLKVNFAGMWWVVDLQVFVVTYVLHITINLSSDYFAYQMGFKFMLNYILRAKK